MMYPSGIRDSDRFMFEDLRRSRGFFLYYWWFFWTAFAFFLRRYSFPSWLVNFVGAIAAF